MATQTEVRDSQAAERALFYAPQVAFDRPVPPVPPAVFRDERAAAFAPDAPTGFVDLDQSAALGCTWPATTPTMLARYAVIRTGESLRHRLQTTGQVYYAIRGTGEATCGAEAFALREGDCFCLPGAADIVLSAPHGAILMVVGNEPELAYLRAAAGSEAAQAIRPTLFRSEEIERHLSEVHGRNAEQRAAGKSVVFLTELMAQRRVTTPTMLCSINSLEAGGDQRPHRHSSAALTLSIAGEGVHSLVDGNKVPWEPDTVIVTPPGAVHSHHNRGTAMMRSFVAQDTGLHTELRTTGFRWTDQD